MIYDLNQIISGNDHHCLVVTARFSLAHNVAEEEQVDSVLKEAAEAGATIVKEAQEIFFGRHGFFADPEGFLWEVAWNPSFPMGTDGSIELPD